MVSLLIGLLYASLQLPLDNRENNQTLVKCLSEPNSQKHLRAKISTYTVVQRSQTISHIVLAWARRAKIDGIWILPISKITMIHEHQFHACVTSINNDPDIFLKGPEKSLLRN